MNDWLETLWCDGCGIEISGPFVETPGKAYCCDDCRTGWGCACGDRLEWEQGRRLAANEAAAVPASLLAVV